MKSPKLLLFLFFFPFISQSQVLSGIWSGGLSNDSLTIRKDQTFEIALSESDGKVYGYVYSTFVVNDTLYYIIKKVKGVIKGTVCEIKDEEVITHNFQRPPEKGINVVYTFRHNELENGWTIDGNWKTNSTKKYYSISGNVSATIEKDISRSRLYEHLGDLNLQHTLVFNNTKDVKPNNIGSKEKVIKKDIVIVSVRPSEPPPQSDIATDQTRKTGKPDIKKKNSSLFAGDITRTEKKPAKEKEAEELVVQSQLNKTAEKIADIGKEQNTTEKNSKEINGIVNSKEDNEKREKLSSEIKKPESKNSTVATVQKPVENKSEVINGIVNSKQENLKDKEINSEIKKPEMKSSSETAVQIPIENKAPIGNTVTVKEQQSNNPVSDIVKTNTNNMQEKNTEPEYVFAELIRKERKLRLASAMIEDRTSVPSETIYFKSDSLVLALYDNGEIDGDTVSVILNDELIIEKQGLKSAAFKKTIYLAPDETDSVLLVLYAENLGRYPPNTGLLIINDGDESYYVRFNADYSKNAAILLRRKLK